MKTVFFCFYPNSTLPNGSINGARAIVTLYYTEGGSTTHYGNWVEPTTNSTWYTALIQNSLNYNVESVKMTIQCQTNFTGWIDLAQLTDP
ncbi:MAG: hypothetical protein PVH73_10130 [Candidatus Bathyarchaeota archaeon]